MGQYQGPLEHDVHTATAAIQIGVRTTHRKLPLSRIQVLQYLRSGKKTPLAIPTGGHRALLMMSFLRRVALKSVTAAKKKSGAKCAGPLQYGVGRPDGANTMTKTIQCFAETDPTRVLVVLELKAHSIEQNDPDLAAVFTKWLHWLHRTLDALAPPAQEITANRGADKRFSSFYMWLRYSP